MRRPTHIEMAGLAPEKRVLVRVAQERAERNVTELFRGRNVALFHQPYDVIAADESRWDVKSVVSYGSFVNVGSKKPTELVIVVSSDYELGNAPYEEWEPTARIVGWAAPGEGCWTYGSPLPGWVPCWYTELASLHPLTRERLREVRDEATGVPLGPDPGRAAAAPARREDYREPNAQEVRRPFGLFNDVLDVHVSDPPVRRKAT